MEIKEKVLYYRVELIVFSIFFIYLLIARMTIPSGKPFLSWYDWDFYIHMAKDPLVIFRREVIAPFCHRPLVPLIVWVIPLNLESSFATINLIALFLTGIVLYFTLRLFFDKKMSITGLFFFCLLNYMLPGIPTFKNHYFFHVYFHLNYMVDPLAYLFIMCCFYSILKLNSKHYCIFLTLGVLTKEIVLFTIPVYIVYLYMNQEDNMKSKEKILEISKNLKYIIPGVGVFILLRIIIIPDSIKNYAYWSFLYEGNDYFSIQMILIFLERRFEELAQGYGFLQYTLGIWGIHTFILFLFNKKREIYNWIKLYGIFMILIYLQLFLGEARTRPIYYGFFPMIFLSISGLNRICEFLTEKKERRSDNV
jgi:hypothetical protein